jgi:hypothetical protein
LGLARTDNLLVESVAGKAEFRVRRTEAVPAGVVAIGVNARRNRALFPLAEESASGVAIPPASVSVAAIPAAGRSPAECTARAE